MVTVLLLKSAFDVLDKNFQGKKFTVRTDPGAPVPDDSINLWKKRGFRPGKTGCAYIKFAETPDREFTFPLYFWGE